MDYNKISKITIEGLNNDYSGGGDTKILREMGYEKKPVVKFGNYEYVMLFIETPHPGHNTAEVINVTEFNDKDFKILVTIANRKKHTEGWAWVNFEDEGTAILAIYTETGKLHEYANPTTAVLSYRIIEPTRDDLQAAQAMLDEETDAAILNQQIELMLNLESKIQRRIPDLLRRLRQERGWSQTELGRKLGISQSYIAQIETGERPVTSELQKKIAELLQQPPAISKLEELITSGMNPRDIQHQLAAMVRESTGQIPRGQLWQPCEQPGCNTEPVCLNCLKCEEHCQCFDAEGMG